MIYIHTQCLASASKAGHVLPSCPWLCNNFSIGLCCRGRCCWGGGGGGCFHHQMRSSLPRQHVCQQTVIFRFLDFFHCTLDANQLPSWGSKMKGGLIYPWPAMVDWMKIVIWLHTFSWCYSMSQMYPGMTWR